MIESGDESADLANDKNEHEQAMNDYCSDSHNERSEHEQLIDENIQPPSQSSTSICNIPSVSVYSNMLKQYAKQHSYLVHDVPDDGDCWFSSVAYQLQSVGHDVDKSTLRQNGS